MARQKLWALWVVAAAVCPAQPNDLDRAYQALVNKDYAQAIAPFQRALTHQQPAAVPKDLAYTLRKVGENARAGAQFAEAVRLGPADDKAALEYAFLCYEPKQPAEARRVFARLRNQARDPADRATATQAFDNIDRPLAEG